MRGTLIKVGNASPHQTLPRLARRYITVHRRSAHQFLRLLNLLHNHRHGRRTNSRGSITATPSCDPACLPRMKTCRRGNARRDEGPMSSAARKLETSVNLMRRRHYVTGSTHGNGGRNSTERQLSRNVDVPKFDPQRAHPIGVAANTGSATEVQPSTDNVAPGTNTRFIEGVRHPLPTAAQLGCEVNQQDRQPAIPNLDLGFSRSSGPRTGGEQSGGNHVSPGMAPASVPCQS